jgi:diguanylate cyclase (GGDEF)-like protein
LRRSRRRALALAATDPLTGLANRRRAERWLAAAGPAACLVVDLDGFKAVNDAFGHPAGDAVLRSVAETLAGAIRSGDRLARLGGDEFLVLLPGTDPAGALVVAERIRARLAGLAVDLPGPDGGPPRRAAVRASVGAAARRPDEPAARLLARADAALLRAKAAGRDRTEADS